MILIENVFIPRWEAAFRGMRNPLNSWDKSDSEFGNGITIIGERDHSLAMKLAKAGSADAKYRRMLIVYLDITAPFYWWKEFDTYKVGTVANSCSTMHKLTHKPFELDDFSHDKMNTDAVKVLGQVIDFLNMQRDIYLNGIHGELKGSKEFWWNMIQLLPSSYNQKRTVMLNYEVLSNMYHSRKNHKLDEWKQFCNWIESLPHSEFITGGRDEGKD